MHVSGERDGQQPRHRLAVLLVLATLLAVVAVASSGGIPLGSSATRRPSQELADTLVSLVLVAFLLGSVVAVLGYVWFLRTQDAASLAERRSRRRRAMLGYVILLLLIGLAARTHFRALRPGGQGGSPTSPVRTPHTPSKPGNGYTPHFATAPVAVVLGALGVAALAAFLAYRSRRHALSSQLEPSLALTLAEVVGETLDDLRAEPDPRKAVVAAYARLERTLAAFGLPRRESDAPEEYLRRILIDLEVGARHAAKLTELFEYAKFSPHRIGPEMKEQAIGLLESIRADLYAADAARKAALAEMPPAGQPA
jgi:hypothetical protein